MNLEEPQKLKYHLKPLLAFIFFITLGYFLGNFYPFSIYSKSWINTKVIPRAECRACPPITAPVTYAQPKGEFKTFTSNKLGIAFSYYEYGSGDQVKDLVKTAEIGNKIYLYINRSKTEPDDPTSGQYIEVFQKDSNQSLEDAVKSAILKEDTKLNCKVINDKSVTNILNPSYEYLHIQSAKTSPEDTPEISRKNADLCNITYTTFWGHNYFVMDKGHPDKFAFVHLGQSSLAFPVIETSGLPYQWDYTISFIK